MDELLQSTAAYLHGRPFRPQALAHPQVAARNMLVTVDDPKSGTLKLAGNPMKISSLADPPTRDPAPDLDADRAAILKELGF